MRTFPLLQLERNNLFLRNPLGCAGFCCLAVFGALTGRAVFTGAYAAEARALLDAVGALAKPRDQMIHTLLYALLPPLTYCAVVYASGARRALLPLWAAAVLGQGALWGMELGGAGELMACGRGGLAWQTALVPMLALLPFYAYVALLALERGKASAQTVGGTHLEQLTRAVLASAALTALSTLLATLSSLAILNRLFD